VLFDLLEVWKQDALSFETFDDPRVVLSSYIRAKMQRSRTRPYGSKVWANEIIHGARRSVGRWMKACTTGPR